MMLLPVLKPFVSINCGAIPENLMEDLLFGHEKGAFTGAIKEHRESLNKQILEHCFWMKSENCLQIFKQNYCAFFKKKYYTFGINNQTKVDFRLIAATNKDLKKAIEDREFREDLYFRISTFRLSIAPLKNRPDDIPLQQI